MPHPQPTAVLQGVEHLPARTAAPPYPSGPTLVSALPGDFTVVSMLPGEVTSAAKARRIVRDHLRVCGDLADDCALIVSELVTNAVLHGGGAVRMRLTAREGWVYAEVGDDGAGLPRRGAGDLDATDGRGLLIVAGLAREWGVVRGPDLRGKTVWFVLGEPG
ncbi:anti-sigma regulatory factor (Ser/Thr protein kinase) [Thermocatellispora tengchongensis]|uniref:Anti-sigma regulatory factor (Ser/Thr protein kinase) n=1 Tax=Thermocatellispora tengchongensis TaxID=1073253 RepID=A0A840P027_9ACTN|nr:ATP-binding protein [Thermocatellispora tengchongensis]MBB5132349.1 anti-sigma regulatory factor (Ser/Thr protein kinase) [Thermocatellispora tengchongensis]